MAQSWADEESLVFHAPTCPACMDSWGRAFTGLSSVSCVCSRFELVTFCLFLIFTLTFKFFYYCLIFLCIVLAVCTSPICPKGGHTLKEVRKELELGWQGSEFTRSNECFHCLHGVVPGGPHWLFYDV